MSSSPEVSPVTTSAIAGYVEGFVGGEVFGWTWKRGSSERLRVELRYGEEIAAVTTADTKRDDLEVNGVGDGCHAFRLAIPSELCDGKADLRVVAVDATGEEASLDRPPSSDVTIVDASELKRSLELLVGSQRVIHRNLQAALLRQGPSLTEGVAAIAASQARLTEALATIEVLVVRLEDVLHGKPQHSQPQSAYLLMKACVALSSLACIVAGLALWRVLALG